MQNIGAILFGAKYRNNCVWKKDRDKALSGFLEALGAFYQARE